MTELRIASTLALPAAEAVTETFGILAKRGAGKTYLGKVMAEEMYAAGMPFVVIDPAGVWWGLRSGIDGASPGLSLPILGGRHGDIPLERTGGSLVADLVVDHRFTCVLDLSGFDSEAAKKQFLLDFARRLYHRNEQPLHLFLEEADDYIPQRPMREEAQLLRAFENIVRRGRARGLGITLITQRSAALSKMVLTQVETLFVLRTSSPQDRKAVEGWVEYHALAKDMLESLPQLENGEAWVWSPHFLSKLERIKVRRLQSFDSSVTPKGASRPAATLAEVDLEILRDRMAATVERAKQEDPAELRKQLAEVRRQLAAAQRVRPPPAPAPPPEVKYVEMPALKEGQLERLEEVAEALGTVAGQITEGLTLVRQGAASPDRKMVTGPGPSPRLRADTPQFPLGGQSWNGTSAGALSGPQQRILNALAWLETVGITPAKKVAVAALAGYHVGGAFNNPLGSLRTQGLVDYPTPGAISLTDQGRASSEAPSTPLTTTELHRMVLERLTGPQCRILGPLLFAYPWEMTRAELAAAAGYELGGAFNNPLGSLRSMGFIDYPAAGQVRALPVLFLEAEPFSGVVV